MAELINGLALGAYHVLAPVYVSEITPVVLSRISTATVNTLMPWDNSLQAEFLLGLRIEPTNGATTFHSHANGYSPSLFS